MNNSVEWKNMPLNKKVEHIWEYYRFHIIVTAAVMIMLGSVIYNIATYREPSFQVLMIDALEQQENKSSGFDAFFDAYGYDKVDTVVDLNTGINFEESGEMSYISAQLLAATIMTGDVDVFFWTNDVLSAYMEQGTLMDLSQVLSAQLLAQYEDSLVYITGEDGEVYPCAIHLQDNAWVMENGYYMDCYFGIFSKAQNMQIASDFAKFILQM